MRLGERARRGYDVFLQRPRGHRNEVWESDHVQAPVEVDVQGRRLKPWVTWFVDTATNAVCGTAITPGPASRESVLAALRAAITLDAPHGPPGGLPGRVRIDQGKDFLSRTVAGVLAGFAVRVEVLPGYSPHLKGTVETINWPPYALAAYCVSHGEEISTRVARPAKGAPVGDDRGYRTRPVFLFGPR